MYFNNLNKTMTKKQKKQTKSINYFQLLLGILLNLLVIIVAFIIYHEVFQKEKLTNSLKTVPETEIVPGEETMPK